MTEKDFCYFSVKRTDCMQKFGNNMVRDIQSPGQAARGLVPCAVMRRYFSQDVPGKYFSAKGTFSTRKVLPRR